MNVPRPQEFERIVVLTGAGISAASGIPTFRDSNGLWENHRLEDVATPEAFSRDPYLVWRFYSMRRIHAGLAAPNPAHFALDAFAAHHSGSVTLVTQNVDGLHRRAQGAGHLEAICMHGTLEKSRCTHCGHVWWDDRAWIDAEGIASDARLLDEGTRASAEALHQYSIRVVDGLPQSPCCAALLRPHIVWFGEEPLFMKHIIADLERCELFVSIGTSGVVYPAASFLELAKDVGAKTVVINREAIPQQHSVDHFLQGSAEDVVPRFFSST